MEPTQCQHRWWGAAPQLSPGRVLAATQCVLHAIERANTTITTSLAVGNITLTPTGNRTVFIDVSSGLVLPTGNTAQRPAPPAVGTVRFNTDSDRLEIYDGAWNDVVANVTNQTLNGDGSTVTFTLDRDSTTASALIMINGVVQLPSTAYAVSGNQLTFSQAPVTADIIDIRFL